MTKTFTERCQLAQQLLPDAQYRTMLTKLHAEMLTKLAEQPAQQEPVAKIEIVRCKFTGELESWMFADRPRNAPAGTYYVYTSQPAQQEPVAYFNPQVKGGFYWAKPTKITAPVTVSVEPMPLYTTPQPAREPLTDEWIESAGGRWVRDGHDLYGFARAIEAAHGITKGNT